MRSYQISRTTLITLKNNEANYTVAVNIKTVATVLSNIEQIHKYNLAFKISQRVNILLADLRIMVIGSFCCDYVLQVLFESIIIYLLVYILNRTFHKCIETDTFKMILFFYQYPSVYSRYIQLHNLSKKVVILLKYDIHLYVFKSTHIIKCLLQ